MKIDRDGVFDLDMDTYHSDCCDGPSVSASVLHKMNDECPAKVWEVSPLNPNHVKDKTKKAFDVGRAAHALTLGEPEFAKYFVISPYDDFRTKEARVWRDAETRTVLNEGVFQEIVAMADARRRSPQCARAFMNGTPERSLICRDAETGIWIKVRPDWLPNDPTKDFLQEYKSARSIQPRRLGMAVFDYGYHVQAAMQFDVAAIVLGIRPLGIAHVCQEKDIPYLAELKMFTGDQLEFGRREYRRALRLFVECWARHLAGKPEREAWPGYTASPDYFLTPRWVEAEMDQSAINVPGAARKYEPHEYAEAL